MKKIIALILVIALLLTPAVALAASNITGATYYSIVTVANNSTATDDIFATFPLPTQNLIDGNFLNDNVTDCAMHNTSGVDTAFMPSVNATYPWCLYVSDIGTNAFRNYLLYTGGNVDMDGKLRYFPGTGGMTSSDNDTLELSDNFTIEQKGWIDTDNGTDKNQVYKPGAFKLYISDTVADNITAAIIPYQDSTTWLSPTAFSDPSNGWNNEPNAYDENTGLKADSDVIGLTAWSENLTLSRASVLTGTIRYWVTVEDAFVNLIDLDAWYGDAWHNVFQGAPVTGAWVEKPIGSWEDVTKVSIRFYNSSGVSGWKAYIHEVDFNETEEGVTASVSATGIESGEHIVKVMQGSNTTSWWDGDWALRKALTFDNSASSENLTNFVVVVKLDNTNFDFSNAQTDGDDVVFIDNDDATALDYYAELYDATTELAIFMVEVAQIDAGSITDLIYMYYNNDSASNSEDMVGTYTSNVVLAETYVGSTATSIIDATSYSNDGTMVASQPDWTQETSGLWVLDFNGTNARVTVPNSASVNITQDLTVSTWLNVTEYDDGGGVYDKNNCWVLPQYSGASNRLDARVKDSLGATTRVTPGASAGALGTWAKVDLVSENGTTLKLYYTGTLAGESPTTRVKPIATNANSIYWGYRVINTDYYKGKMALMKIYDDIPSTDWLLATYNSEKVLFGGASDFVTFGSEIINGLRIYIDDILQEWTGSVTVPNNSNDWTFVENYSVPYMHHHKIWIGGTLQQHIEWEYDDTVFSDLAEQNHPAYPTFRGASSDADVSGVLASFTPIEEAQAPTWVLEEERDFWDTENITAASDFATTPTPTAAPLVAVVVALSEATGTPSQLPFTVIASFVIIAISLVASWFMVKHGSRNLWMKIIMITICMAVCVAVGVMDFWMVIFFLMMSIAVALFSRQRSTT